MSETAILKRTMLALARIPSIRFWRNNSGQAWMGRAIQLTAGQRVVAQAGDVLIKGARPVRFGLTGSADIIGMASPAGRFIAVETKAGKGTQSGEQVAFQRMVEALGGVYIVARDPEQARADLLAALETA